MREPAFLPGHSRQGDEFEASVRSLLTRRKWCARRGRCLGGCTSPKVQGALRGVRQEGDSNLNRSLCSHLAGNAKQPMVLYTDGNGIESFLCCACASEKTCELLSDDFASDVIRQRLNFARCHNYGEGWRNCHHCTSAFRGALMMTKALSSRREPAPVAKDRQPTCKPEPSHRR